MAIARLLTMLLVLLAAGCASITTGSEQALRVATEPEGAHCVVSRDGQAIATILSTPAAIFVPKSGHDIAVNCALANHANGAAVIPASMQGAVFGNILFGGWLGYGIDLASGAAAEYPRGVRMWLDPLPSERSRIAALPEASIR